MAYTTIDDSSAYFQIKIYSGNAGVQALTFDGNTDMQPDWVWLKKRNGAANHHVIDSVRGAGVYLYPNLTNADGGDGYDGDGNDLLASFNSNGFTIDGGADSNANNATGVAWSWKAGTSFTNDASSTSVGSIDSAGSVNDTAGFSIVSYTGTGSNATLKHGLSTVPKMIIVKNRSTAQHWQVYHTSTGNTKSSQLSGGGAPDTAATYWNNTSPTSSVFSIGSGAPTNGDGNAIIAYCFAEKTGYSKFSSFVGNGNANGTFVYTGFKPAFIFLKNTERNINWEILDNKRPSTGQNPADDILFPNTNDAESSSQTDRLVDFVSNGIKIRGTSNQMNASGQKFIYMAFAENPLVTSTGVPTTAR